MPIISRRSTQNIIYGLLSSINLKPIDELVEKLNKENKQSLEALWEIIVISLLTKLGKVEYEREHGGNTKPDIHFRHKSGLEFLADVTCVSDFAQHKSNDIEFFIKELGQAAKKAGMPNLNGLSIRIEDHKNLIENKIKLKLPPKNSSRQFINDKLKLFLTGISSSRHKESSIKIAENDIELSLNYNPKLRYLSVNSTLFTVAKFKKNNPIYNRLKDKSGQLKNSGFNGLKGIILCDGGCQLVNSSITGRTSYSIESIVDNFLKSQTTLDFVIILYIKEEKHAPLQHRRARSFEIKYMSKQKCDFEIGELTNDIFSLFDSFPTPIRTPINAASALANNHSFPGTTFYGGFNMTDNKVSISARAILDLINGKLSSDDLLNDHSNAGRLLKRKITQGYRLQSISLKQLVDKDDDWIEFSFNDSSDPSVSKYTTKKN